jgi:hypothetical protein
MVLFMMMTPETKAINRVSTELGRATTSPTPQPSRDAPASTNLSIERPTETALATANLFASVGG